MSVKKRFSPAEVEKLRANPYTERVMAGQISFMWRSRRNSGV